MFGNLVYYNKEKVDQYTALITGQPVQANIRYDDFSVEKNTNLLLECSKFEDLLQSREDYVDFTGGFQDTDIADVRVASIIRATGEIYVPEAFDMVHLINEYKPLLLSTVKCKDDDERQMLNSVFSNTKAKVPLFCELGSECDYWLGIGKISQKNLVIEYTDLEDLEGTQVTIIAKLESRKLHKDRPLQVFDIYRDFLGLNRTFRKQLQQNHSGSNEFESIMVEEDYLGLEILAIY